MGAFMGGALGCEGCVPKEEGRDGARHIRAEVVPAHQKRAGNAGRVDLEFTGPVFELYIAVDARGGVLGAFLCKP